MGDGDGLKLIERIGIDRSVLYGFTVLSIDVDRLKQCQYENKTFVDLVEDERSPIVLADGRRIGKLVVQSQAIGKLCIEFRKNNLNMTEHIVSTLEMMVSADGNNLQNLNADGYRDRIGEVFDLLKNGYGIEIAYESIRLKKVELNATFRLDEPYENYKKAILLLIRNVPASRYGSDTNRNSVKYAAWSEAMKGRDKLETILVKNSSLELKIYNKTKHLEDIRTLDNTGKDCMRIEFLIKDARILSNAWGDNLVADLTDEGIRNLFLKFFRRDIAEPYERWSKENQKELLKLAIKHKRESPKRWVSNFIRDCRQIESKQGLPILFDIADMKDVFKRIEPKAGRNNSSHRFKRFKKQATFEQDLEGNSRRVREIIDKVLTM